ncbi:hypothetical protein D3C80_1070250 [compost metagenome]
MSGTLKPGNRIIRCSSWSKTPSFRSYNCPCRIGISSGSSNTSGTCIILNTNNSKTFVPVCTQWFIIDIYIYHVRCFIQNHHTSGANSRAASIIILTHIIERYHKNSTWCCTKQIPVYSSSRISNSWIHIMIYSEDITGSC